MRHYALHGSLQFISMATCNCVRRAQTGYGGPCKRHLSYVASKRRAISDAIFCQILDDSCSKVKRVQGAPMLNLVKCDVTNDVLVTRIYRSTFSELDTSWGWVVSSTSLQPFTPGKRAPGIHRKGGLWPSGIEPGTAQSSSPYAVGMYSKSVRGWRQSPWVGTNRQANFVMMCRAPSRSFVWRLLIASVEAHPSTSGRRVGVQVEGCN
jgi:hypothetical protein